MARRCWRDVAPEAAQNMLDDLRVVDVRTFDETNGPLAALDAAEVVPLPTIVSAMKAWQHDEPLLVVCRSGKRAQLACQALCAAGFSEVYNLAGGMMAWHERGLPC